MKIMSVRNCLPTMSHLPSTTNPKKRSQFVIWKIEAVEREKIQRETAKQKALEEIEMKKREADEACLRIENLPTEIKCFILHFDDITKCISPTLIHEQLPSFASTGEPWTFIY